MSKHTRRNIFAEIDKPISGLSVKNSLVMFSSLRSYRNGLSRLYYIFILYEMVIILCSTLCVQTRAAKDRSCLLDDDEALGDTFFTLFCGPGCFVQEMVSTGFRTPTKTLLSDGMNCGILR